MESAYDELTIECACGCGESLVIGRESRGYENINPKNAPYIEIGGVIIQERDLIDALLSLKNRQEGDDQDADVN